LTAASFVHDQHVGSELLCQLYGFRLAGVQFSR
jgi:hypothetical protein